MDLKIEIVKSVRKDILTMFRELVEFESFISKYFDLTNPENLDIAIIQFFDSILKREENIVILAIAYGDPVGFAIAGVMTRPSFHKVPIVGFIEDLYVRAKYRKKGIGKKMIKKIESIFVQRGVDESTLFVIADNDEANQAYLKMGYEVESLRFSKRLE